VARGSDYPLAGALKAVQAGLSARAGLRQFRAGGGRTTDSTWFRVVAEVRRSLSDRINEANRPLNRRPGGQEITTMTTRTKTGFWQQVEIFTRDKATGEVVSTPFVVRGQGLLTRQAAMRVALDEWEAGAAGSVNPDESEVLGAAYTSTLELQPGPAVDFGIGGGGSPPQPATPPAQAPAQAPADRAAQVQAQILTAHAQALSDRASASVPRSGAATDQGGPASLPMVMLGDLRDRVSGMTREEFDQAVLAISRRPGNQLLPDEGRGAISQGDRDAAIIIGAQERHSLYIGR
jgi:hypothetical protein